MLFLTVLPSRGRHSAASEGPSNQQVIDYIREDLERERSEVRRHFNISRKRTVRLFASARSQLTDRDIVNFLRPREDWSKGAVLEKLRITESRYARCVAELRAATPVDRTCVLRFLRAGNRRRCKKDAWPGSTSALLSLIRLVLGWPGRLGWGGFCVYVKSVSTPVRPAAFTPDSAPRVRSFNQPTADSRLLTPFLIVDFSHLSAPRLLWNIGNSYFFNSIIQCLIAPLAGQPQTRKRT